MQKRVDQDKFLPALPWPSAGPNAHQTLLERRLWSLSCFAAFRGGAPSTSWKPTLSSKRLPC